MSVLAHVFEAAGIATVVLSSVREMAAKVSPPRTLHCEFPLGRPLGKPGDEAFQHDVLARAFGLLERAVGPVFEEHPEVIEADEQPLACTIPPRFDPSLPPAVDEARGLRKAFDRTLGQRGVTSVGRVIDADGVPGALAMLHGIANGDSWADATITGKLGDLTFGRNTNALCHDIRTYYEEAALALIDVVPAGRALEDWYFDTTEAGRTVLAARTVMREAGAPFPVWFYMTPGQR